MSRVCFGSADEFVGHPESRGQYDGGTAILFTGTRSGDSSRGFGFGCLIICGSHVCAPHPGFEESRECQSK